MRLRDIVKKHSSESVGEEFIGGVAGCPDDYPELFENPWDWKEAPKCGRHGSNFCEDCWDQEYCPAEDCISCDNVDCILHPGDGDD